MVYSMSNELIKVSGANHPINEMMLDTLTENECDDLISMMRYCLEHNDFEYFKNSEYYTESYYVNEGVVGDFFIKQLIKLMEIFCKNKYRLQVQKFYSMSKELNDIYTKVAYLLNNDKVARFKHRNDLIDVTTKSVIMRDKVDGTAYNIMLAELYYSLDSINGIIKNAMANVETGCTKEQSALLRARADSIVNSTNESFRQKYGYVDSCTVDFTTNKYPNCKFEDGILYFKSMVEMYYNNIKYINDGVSDQLVIIKYLDGMYNRFINRYGKNEDCKYFIDTVFKCVIDNMNKAIDFNAAITDASIVSIKYASDELHKIYDILKK